MARPGANAGESCSDAPLAAGGSDGIQHRVLFDFEITFGNGGGLQGQDFRLDIDGNRIDDQTLAERLVDDLRLLMVATVRITRSRVVVEAHKRR